MMELKERQDYLEVYFEILPLLISQFLQDGLLGTIFNDSTGTCNILLS
jgi:hypothetical protein